MRRFEFVEGKSSKFWQIEQVAADLHIQWGRIGTAGQSQVKTFADEAKAAAALLKLIAEKISKGYVEVSDAPAQTPSAVAAASPQPPAPTPSTEPSPTATCVEPQASEPAPVLDNVAPWLANGDPVHIPASLMKHVLPSRRFPQPLPSVDAEAIWQQIRGALAEVAQFDLEKCHPSLHEHVQTAQRRMQQTAIQEESVGSDAVLLYQALADSGYTPRHGLSLGERFVHYLVSRHGLPSALEVLLAAQPWMLGGDFNYSARTHKRFFSLNVNGPMAGRYRTVSPGEWLFRRYLALAPEAEWQACKARIRAVLPAFHPERQIMLALLVPDSPELAAELVERISNHKLSMLLLNLRDEQAIARVIKASRQYGSSGWDNENIILTLVHELGSAAEAVLLPAKDHAKATQIALTCIGTPQAVAALACVPYPDKHKSARFTEACSRWPLAAIAGLAQLLAERGKEMAQLRPQLANLLRGHAGEIARLLPWLSPEAAETLRKEAARLDAPAEIAALDELPPVLVSPPWLKPRAGKPAKAMDLQPLSLAPVECWPAGVREALLQRIDAPAPGLPDAKKIARRLEFDTSQLDHAARAIEQNDTQGLLDAWDRSCALKAEERYGYVSLDGSDVLKLPDDLAVALWNHALAHLGCVESFWVEEIELVLARHGLRVLPALLALLGRRPATARAHVAAFGAVEIAPCMARAFARLKAHRATARTWLLAWPEHAACGMIAPAIGKPGEVRNHAASALRLLASQGHEPLILEVAARYARPEVIDAVRAMLDEDPLDQFPAKRSALPSFWQPQCWTQPLLRDGGKALPAEALDILGQMMTFPVVDGPYAGLLQVREACTPQSLGEFSWDCFTAWLNQGAPAKENWAFTMLGHLGNDDSARRLAPFIRTWPAKGGFAHAVKGLDVLTSIGSDVSLMLLNGLAQKAKSKPLQARAREKIQAIAEARGLSTEELEDRLVPTFGLDAQGTLLLDFGPRRFTVGFDESLKPYVRDDSGARLANLPKPKKTDDPALSEAASESFKHLKKDVRSIASEQVRRLEAAMCSQRRWLPDTFRQCLAEHPLLRHLVQRLVWGVYAVEGFEDDESGNGGRLLQCFRIAEDGAATNAEDDPLDLPQGANLRYGLPHALELPAEDAAAFAQLLADYQLMQPFQQVGRDTYSLTAAERASGKLLRWEGTVIDTGRLFSLAHRGWQRGAPEDAGFYYHYSKPVDQQRMLMLTFEPGVQVASPDYEPRQTLKTVYLGRPKGGYYPSVDEEPFDGLDTIHSSELIRDLENLRA